MAASPIEGKELTTWNVPPGGLRIALHFIGSDDEAHCVVLPVDALSGLMMTLPGMLAIRARCTPPAEFIPDHALDRTLTIGTVGRSGRSDPETANT